MQCEDWKRECSCTIKHWCKFRWITFSKTVFDRTFENEAPHFQRTKTEKKYWNYIVTYPNESKLQQVLSDCWCLQRSKMYIQHTEHQYLPFVYIPQWCATLDQDLVYCSAVYCNKQNGYKSTNSHRIHKHILLYLFNQFSLSLNGNHCFILRCAAVYYPSILHFAYTAHPASSAVIHYKSVSSVRMGRLLLSVKWTVGSLG